jgi:uridine kinase
VDGRTLILGLDSYYRDFSGVAEEDIEVDVPDALDRPLLAGQVRALAEGKTVDKPVYDYATHSRQPRGVSVEPGEYVLVEGLFALYWQDVRDSFDLAVFVDIDHDSALERRIERDVRERGRTEASVRMVYAEKVRPNYERFVFPTRAHAHVVVDGSERVGASVGTILERFSGRA